MNKDELFTDDFLKQFKTGDELTGFLKKIQKRGIQKMLEGELDGHLGYEKNKKRSQSNARNDFNTKKVKSSFGETQIKVPRDRDAFFNPMIIPKRRNKVDGIENIIVFLYSMGMSNSDTEQIRNLYDLMSPHLLFPEYQDALVKAL